MKDADKVPFLDSPVTPAGMFGPAVESTQPIAVIERKIKPKHSCNMRCSSGPLEEPSVDGTGRAPGHGLQKESSLDRRLQLRFRALCNGKPAFSLWSKKEGYLHISCLEMLAVCLGLRTFLPDMKGHHVLVRSDSMMGVSYINLQGGLSSTRLFILAERLLRWAKTSTCLHFFPTRIPTCSPSLVLRN